MGLVDASAVRVQSTRRTLTHQVTGLDRARWFLEGLHHVKRFFDNLSGVDLKCTPKQREHCECVGSDVANRFAGRPGLVLGGFFFGMTVSMDGAAAVRLELNQSPWQPIPA